LERSTELDGWGRILDAALDAVLVMDDRGRVVDLNERARATFGYTREEAIGVELAELVVPPALRARHREGLARYLASGTSQILGRRIELTAVRADGTEFPVELTVTRAAPPGLFVGFVRDLTERRRSEQRLAAQHRVTEILARSADLREAASEALEAISQTLGWQVGCLWELDHDEGCLRCVHVWCGEGVDAAEFARVSRELAFVPGVGLPGRVWGDARSVWVENMAAERAFPRAPLAERAGLHGAFGAPILLGGRLLGVIEFFNSEVREPDPELLAMIGAIGSQLGQFIERKQAEEALRRSEETYRLLFERHPAPMWVYEPESLRFLAVNEAAIATYGYTREEFLSMTIEQIRPAEDSVALRTMISDPSRGRVEAGVWRHVRKDGSIIAAAVSSNALEFDGRRARLVLARDVTEQQRLEEQLRQAQKMEAVGNLAGGIAHDFNNIMMIIRTSSAFLERRLTDEALLVDLRRIDRAALRAVDLTRQLLAFSRRQLLQPRVVNANDVVEDTLQLLRRVIDEDIELVVDLADPLDSIMVDPGQLVQVVLNLAVNARDAMPGGGQLTIRTANVVIDESHAAEHVGVAPGNYVLVQVTDTGVGMDETTRQKVFEPFFTTREGGTGLGLSTVHGIVNQSGGHIWLYSEPAIGTTFKLYFPRVGLPVVPVATDVEVASLEGDETVLLVEDEESLRTLIAQGLESYGYTVLDASGGPEALRIAAEHNGSIALLITDVVMPGMSGGELARRLAVASPGVKVLYTSGYPADTVVRHGIADQSAAFIEKPYLPDELARTIRAVLDY